MIGLSRPLVNGRNSWARLCALLRLQRRLKIKRVRLSLTQPEASTDERFANENRQ
eukprot:m.257646 g.257646  ORF g.257646 m.257646 type:complete len:55 (-) comp54567_c0_seq51:982-1146(-)